ncbi:hypothetical protein, partial [Anaerobutyricum hallii]
GRCILLVEDNRCILLVEDNELNSEIAVEILKEYGFLVDTASICAVSTVITIFCGFIFIFTIYSVLPV